MAACSSCTAGSGWYALTRSCAPPLEMLCEQCGERYAYVVEAAHHCHGTARAVLKCKWINTLQTASVTDFAATFSNRAEKEQGPHHGIRHERDHYIRASRAC